MQVNASKNYYVDIKIMKRGYLFDTVLLLVGLCILLYKNLNISFNIWLLLYGLYQFEQKKLTSAYFRRVTYKHNSYLVL